MNEQSQLDFLDILTLLSFVLQIQNQSNIIGIRDVQKEVDRAIGEIHAHLEQQDAKLNQLLEDRKHEDHQGTV